MTNYNLQNKIINSAKWTTCTEIATKLITPITNMILARIISPEAFGVVATVTMIISFADMLTDAGFQKYIVQHEFKSEKEKFNSANIAFWTNMGVSIFIWLIIIVFRDKIAKIVGNPNLGNVIAIASVQLIFTSFSSIQMALYKREFRFKNLFLIKIISSFVPFIITIPLAFIGFSYWSIIIGSLMVQVINAVLLTLRSEWRPKFYYNINQLKLMLSFSTWTLIESISIWLTTWIDMFIIGNALNQYDLGIYKTSTTMVNTLMALITSSIIPVFFSALSRLQEDDKRFKDVFFNFQKNTAIIVLPLGVGIYLYKDLAATILLGNNWNKAGDVIGIWALTSSIMIVFGSFCSEVYRAKGKPKLSFWAQILHLIVLIPVCIISSKYGFWALVYWRSLIRLQGVLIHSILMKKYIGISFKITIINIIPAIISTIIMGISGYCLTLIDYGVIWSFVSIIICILIYFGVLLLFPEIRKNIKGLQDMLKI